MSKNKPFSFAPADISVNASGEIIITNPDLLKELSSKLELEGPISDANHDNYIACGNNYQCGKAKELKDLASEMGKLGGFSPRK